MTSKKRRNFTCKVILEGKTVDSIRTHSLRTFLKYLRTINWSNSAIKVYLRVSYGYKIGDVTAYNSGTYSNKHDLWLAFNAFNEED
jgi:hypothetical protein